MLPRRFLFPGESALAVAGGIEEDVATARQIAANRLNSKKSPGPSSPEAKAKVAQNRTVHGLCGKFCVRPFESQERLDALLDALTQAEKQADASEMELVVKMAQHTWLARRALRAQDNCLVRAC